jgi:hypothetical protein
MLKGGIGVDTIDISTKMSNDLAYLNVFASSYKCLQVRGVLGEKTSVEEEINVVQWSEINVKTYNLFGSQNGNPLIFSIQPTNSEENVEINSIGTSPQTNNTVYFSGKRKKSKNFFYKFFFKKKKK